MRKKQFHGITVTLNRTSLKRYMALVIAGIIILFLFAGMLTSVEPGYGLASTQVHEWASEFTGEHFVHVLAMENQYFAQVLPEDSEPLHVSNLAFRVATSINPDDPRSLLGRELPGFALFDGRIAVAGEGTDYTNLPIESAPPMEVLMAEREATEESLAMLEQLEEDANAIESTNGKKVVHIIHSHNYESFLPELETDVPNEAHHSKINITLVGEKFSQELEKRGIGAEVEQRDIQASLTERGWGYPRSYDASREMVEEAMAQNQDLQFFFDIHRDSLPRDRTTVTINGAEYARTIFVIGGNNSNYKHNLHMAEELHNMLEETYPGLSRGVIIKEGATTNGRFNQDLSNQSILMEVGGIDNTLEETYRTAEAVADVFADYYWQAEAVDAGTEKGEE
ncbi:stage II sporulation protein P [Halalkalibacter oceani]|uniref:stage II sporulation protein P n=1 Tax=Halalkalibacter oceani TaxID=1653776 RepID=UPI003394C4F3